MITFTEPLTMLPNEVFLDTAFAIALSVASDEHHLPALLLSDELETQNVRLVTTRAVLFEIGNALAKLRYRQAAVELLDALKNDPNIETDEHFQQAGFQALLR